MTYGQSFNRESDSVTVGANLTDEEDAPVVPVSIAKAIPSLLEPVSPCWFGPDWLVSIAKAIPSLLEHRQASGWVQEFFVSIAKAIPSLLEPMTGISPSTL